MSKCAYGADLDRNAVEVGRFCLSLPVCQLPECLPVSLNQRWRAPCQIYINSRGIWSTRHTYPRGIFCLQPIRKDAVAVKTLCAAGHPIKCCTDIVKCNVQNGVQCTSPQNTAIPGFACLLTNPPYLKKNHLLKSYRNIMSNGTAGIDFKCVSMFDMLSSRFTCCSNVGQPNVFMMLVETSIHLLRTHGTGMIISPSILVHDSISIFDRDFLEHCRINVMANQLTSGCYKCHMLRSGEMLTSLKELNVIQCCLASTILPRKQQQPSNLNY